MDGTPDFTGRAKPDNPLELEFRTSTMQPLLQDLAHWSQRDFVSCSVLQGPNTALTDRQMLRGKPLEEAETWRRSRDQGLNLKRVLAMLILPEGPGVSGGVSLYREDPRPFPQKSPGIALPWTQQLALLIRANGHVRPDLWTWSREGTCRDLEATFLPLPRAVGSRLVSVVACSHVPIAGSVPTPFTACTSRVTQISAHRR